MDSIILEFAGKKVTVHSNLPTNEKQDVGIVEGFDGHWLKIRKSETEVLFFSIHQVRMVKLFNT